MRICTCLSKIHTPDIICYLYKHRLLRSQMGLQRFHLCSDRRELYFFSHFTFGRPTIGLYKGTGKTYPGLVYTYRITMSMNTYIIWCATNLIIKTVGFEYANPKM